MPFFDAEYFRNRTTYRHSFNEILIETYTRPTQHTHRHSFNEILIETYTRPTQQCHFDEWFRMISSDLAKYPMTRSVARSLCDSWASCRNNGCQTEALSTYCWPNKTIFSTALVGSLGRSPPKFETRVRHWETLPNPFSISGGDAFQQRDRLTANLTSLHCHGPRGRSAIFLSALRANKLGAAAADDRIASI